MLLRGEQVFQVAGVGGDGAERDGKRGGAGEKDGLQRQRSWVVSCPRG